jgi:hypothetical protein
MATVELAADTFEHTITGIHSPPAERATSSR